MFFTGIWELLIIAAILFVLVAVPIIVVVVVLVVVKRGQPSTRDEPQDREDLVRGDG